MKDKIYKITESEILNKYINQFYISQYNHSNKTLLKMFAYNFMLIILTLGSIIIKVDYTDNFNSKISKIYFFKYK